MKQIEKKKEKRKKSRPDRKTSMKNNKTVREV